MRSLSPTRPHGCACCLPTLKHSPTMRVRVFWQHWHALTDLQGPAFSCARCDTQHCAGAGRHELRVCQPCRPRSQGHRLPPGRRHVRPGPISAELAAPVASGLIQSPSQGVLMQPTPWRLSWRPGPERCAAQGTACIKHLKSQSAVEHLSEAFAVVHEDADGCAHRHPRTTLLQLQPVSTCSHRLLKCIQYSLSWGDSMVHAGH